MTFLETANSILDTFLPLLTMAFGIYGATNDTKPKDGKITRAGRIAIWGIVLSALCSVFIKVGNLSIQSEKQKRENARLLHVADSLRIRDSEETSFKAKLDLSLRTSVDGIADLTKKSDTSLSNLKTLTKDQQTVITNSLRSIQPLRPLEITITSTITPEDPGFTPYFNRLLDLKRKLEAHIDSSMGRGISASRKPGNRNEVDYITITDKLNAYFPARGSERIWNTIFSGWGIYISPEKFDPQNRLTIKALWIAINPSEDTGYLRLTIDFTKKKLQWLYSTSHFSAFEDRTNGIYSIYDIRGHYLTVTNPFYKGAVKLDDVLLATGENYWHLTKINFKDQLPVTMSNQIPYFTHMIRPSEIR